MLMMEGDIIRTIRQNVQHVGHFHTVRTDRNDLDGTRELYCPPITRAIAATDYDGYVGLEFSPRIGADWATSLRAAYKFCNV